VNINRAGRQTKAYWRSEQANRKRWMAEKPITGPEKTYGQFLRTEERLQGHAAGWIAGVRWAKAEAKRKK